MDCQDRAAGGDEWTGDENMNVIRLAASQERRPVRACGTCRFYRRHSMTSCTATDRMAFLARRYECNYGEMWEPKPPSIWRRLVALFRSESE